MGTTAPATHNEGGLDTFSRRALLVLLAISLLLSLCFVSAVPIGDNPDETAHRDYIHLIVEQHGFVKFFPRGELPEGAPSRDEAHQPPLYYLLCVPVYMATGNSFAVRLVATILQLVTVVLAFFAGRDLFPRRPEIAIGIAAFVTVLPIQAQLGGAINNDALNTLICAAIFWRLGVLLRQGQTIRDMIVLGVLFGLGIWTKLSVIQLVPAMIVAYILTIRSGKLTFGKAFGYCAGALILGVAIASPWLIRNTLLYGDPLTLAIYRLTGPNFSPTDIQAMAHWSLPDYLRQVGVRSFATFFYFLRPDLPFTRFTGAPLPLVLVLLVSLASLGLFYRRAKEGIFAGEQGRSLLLYLLAVPLLLPFYIRFNLTVFQAQGRYFLPALLPVAVITTVAWLGRSLNNNEDKRAPQWLTVLYVPAVLLLLTIYQLLGNGFVR